MWSEALCDDRQLLMDICRTARQMTNVVVIDCARRAKSIDKIEKSQNLALENACRGRPIGTLPRAWYPLCSLCSDILGCVLKRSFFCPTAPMYFAGWAEVVKILMACIDRYDRL